MITIYGRATSSNVQTVMWAISELELPHKRLDVGGAFGGTDTPEYLALNPNGLVPTMEDGGLVLFEAHAITRYLAAQYGSEKMLRSKDARDVAISDMWMEWAKTTVYPLVIAGLFVNLVRVKQADRDPAVMKILEQRAAAAMTIADAQLAKHDWLAGDHFSVADIGFGTLLYRYFTLDFNRADLPNLASYYEKLTNRPAYKKHAMVDYSAMKVS